MFAVFLNVAVLVVYGFGFLVSLIYFKVNDSSPESDHKVYQVTQNPQEFDSLISVCCCELTVSARYCKHFDK